MRTIIYSALLLFINICISSGQMVRTSHGPNIYINPIMVKEKKIRNLSVVEYSLSGGKKTLMDKYDISFDTAGKPSVKSNRSPFRKPDAYDTVIYDNNKNMVRVKSNKNFEYLYKYDNQNREIYFFAINYTAKGPRFSVTNYKYDTHSRISSSDTREGKGADSTKADIRYLVTYSYDNIKLLDVKEKKMLLNKSNGEPETSETVYSFEYDHGVLKRVHANSTLNGLEIVVSPENKR
jgi:hypothetical protein